LCSLVKTRLRSSREESLFLVSKGGGAMAMAMAVARGSNLVVDITSSSPVNSNGSFSPDKDVHVPVDCVVSASKSMTLGCFDAGRW
jgi:hypothetical protein